MLNRYLKILNIHIEMLKTLKWTENGLFHDIQFIWSPGLTRLREAGRRPPRVPERREFSAAPEAAELGTGQPTNSAPERWGRSRATGPELRFEYENNKIVNWLNRQNIVVPYSKHNSGIMMVLGLYPASILIREVSAIGLQGKCLCKRSSCFVHTGRELLRNLGSSELHK